MQQEDYTFELITKWDSVGHLVGVREDDRIHVAQRLESAHRRSLGPAGDTLALGFELNRLRKEGYIQNDGHDLCVQQLRGNHKRIADDRKRLSAIPRPTRDATIDSQNVYRQRQYVKRCAVSSST